MARVSDSGLAIIYLGCIGSGIHMKSNIHASAGSNYQRSKRVLAKLVDLGYIMYDGNDIVLTSKGEKFCMFASEFRDAFIVTGKQIGRAHV